MPADSSSISSSDDALAERPVTVRGMALAALWTLLWLAAADVAVNVVFAWPAEGPTRAGEFDKYFYYGQSAEKKMRDMLDPRHHPFQSLLTTGWASPDLASHPLPPRAESPPDSIRVLGFGMSFTFRTLHALSQVDPHAQAEIYGGPSSTINHSFNQFLAHRDRVPEADFVVMGILAQCLPMIHTMAHATWNIEYASPHTYPRFVLDEQGELVREDPPYDTLAQFEEWINEPSQWQQVRDQLSARDAFYTSWAYVQTPLDRSAVARLIRRSVTQRAFAQRTQRYGLDGEQSEQTRRVAIALVRWFVTEVRADGGRPLILLYENPQQDGQLKAMFAPMFEELDVPSFSMTEHVGDTDPADFDDTGHYLRPFDLIAARDLLTLLRSELQSQGL
ncbi:MAG: hypothetical protein IT445_16100 [Phycisphaeraceae bacterium]|nr:hypothetical protein [Phycisphaeraceae bacterium]